MVHKDLYMLAKEYNGKEAKAVRQLLLQNTARGIKERKGKSKDIIDTDGKAENCQPYYVAQRIISESQKIQPFGDKVYYENEKEVKLAVGLTLIDKIRPHLHDSDLNAISNRVKNSLFDKSMKDKPF